LAIVQLIQEHDALLSGLDHELAEPVEASVALVEIWIDLLHHLLEAVRTHDVSIARHLRDRLTGQLPRIPLG
jgi:hypothetical protein